MKTGIRHGVIALVISSASIIPATAQTPAEPPVKTFRSATDLVSIQASVRDKRGRPLNSLKTADFEVLDNGQVRPILSLRADRQSPVSLAILVDMSGSMAVASKMAMARQAYATLLSQLRDGQDEVAVFTFDSALHQRQQFTSDLRSIRSALDEFNPFGTTSLYDATAATARHVASRSATHKAIIILTDGIDTSSSLTAPQVSGLASSIDVPVYVVATLPAMDETAIKEAAGRQTRIGWRRPARSRGVDGRSTALLEQLRGDRDRGDTIARRTASALRARHRSRQHLRVAPPRSPSQAPRSRRQGAQRIFRRVEPQGPA